MGTMMTSILSKQMPKAILTENFSTEERPLRCEAMPLFVPAKTLHKSGAFRAIYFFGIWDLYFGICILHLILKI